MKAKKVFENIEFKRGEDPRKSLSIGIDRFVNDIDCEDWHIFYGTSGDLDPDVTDEKVLNYIKDYELTKYETEKFLWFWNLYRTGVIEIGEYFDWKQSNAAREYVEENIKGRQAYDVIPENDWLIVFCPIYFPNSEDCNITV